VLIALAAGVGGAYAVSRAVISNQEEIRETVDNWRNGEAGFPCDTPGGQDASRCRPGNGKYPPGQLKKDWGQPGNRGRMDPGMMRKGEYFQDGARQGERIPIDKAFEAAQEYAGEMAENLRVVEVMEFSRNLYAVVLESDTGRGAAELLIDPYTACVMLEMGPTRMWNTKYGHMQLRVDEPVANTLSVEGAVTAAQDYLDEEMSGAEVEADGIEFYGYFSFDYTVDGEVAGMLSVNGITGQVWPHTWHGEFLDEKEFDE
jgi:hypothetical protein